MKLPPRCAYGLLPPKGALSGFGRPGATEMERPPRGIALAWLVCALLAAPMAAKAAGWPEQPIRLIAPFSAGSTVDILSRALSAPLSQDLGQSVVVENRGGAGGNIGVSVVAKSAADGYTLGIGTTGPLTINPHLMDKMPFDTYKDLAPVSLVAAGPNVLVVNPDVPARTLAELVAYARSHPGRLNFASSGVGSTNHLAGELFKLAAKVEIVHVPYKGNQDALNDILAKRVDILFSGLPPIMGQIQAGQLRPLAIAGPQRVAALPDVPTLAEAGVPGAEVIAWYGVVAPAGTPEPVLDRLNQAVRKAVDAEPTRKQFAAVGTDPQSTTRQEFARIIDADFRKWQQVIDKAGIRSK